MKILSIEAWGNKKEGYEWNQWHTVGEISKEEYEKLKTEKQVLLWMKNQGYTTTANKRMAKVEDDQYNLVIADARTDRPIFAIEYGREY